MSELDDLKNDAQKYAKDHPQQVKEGEQELERKLAPDGVQGSQPTDRDQEGHGQGGGTDQDGEQDQDAASRDSGASR